MKIFSIIKKSIKEQIRNFWILILTISLAPFFVVVWYLVDQGMSKKYSVVVVNHDKGVITANSSLVFHGNEFINLLSGINSSQDDWLLEVNELNNMDSAKKMLEEAKADMILVIAPDFSININKLQLTKNQAVDIEFIGDLTDNNYLMAAIWSHNYLSEFISFTAGVAFPVNLVETSIGKSGSKSEFDLYVPGLLIFAIIMLMFSASIAFVVEPETQTIKRIKLSKVKPMEFIGGISIVQIMLGIISIILTLIVAVAFGFQVEGSFGLMTLIGILCSISIIAFSLILAALSKTVNAILVVGNFPLFLFMFFTGAMFPINLSPIITIGGYSLTANCLLSPVHAIYALKKVLIFGSGFSAILPEVISLIILSVLYFIIGLWLFKRKHFRAE